MLWSFCLVAIHLLAKFASVFFLQFQLVGSITNSRLLKPAIVVIRNENFLILFSRLSSTTFRYLLPLLLQYDSTAEESETKESHGVGASVQIAKNLHALRASQALSKLSGMCSDESPTPYNQAAADALRTLLTPKVASLLKDPEPKDLLSKINANLESPEVHSGLLFYFSRYFCLSALRYLKSDLSDIQSLSICQFTNWYNEFSFHELA